MSGNIRKPFTLYNEYTLIKMGGEECRKYTGMNLLAKDLKITSLGYITYMKLQVQRHGTSLRSLLPYCLKVQQYNYQLRVRLSYVESPCQHDYLFFNLSQFDE
jgi:hypothetical protein